MTRPICLEPEQVELINSHPSYKGLSRKDQDLSSETLRKSPQVKKIFCLKALFCGKAKGKGKGNGKGRGRSRGKKVYPV